MKKALVVFRAFIGGHLFLSLLLFNSLFAQYTRGTTNLPLESAQFFTTNSVEQIAEPVSDEVAKTVTEAAQALVTPTIITNMIEFSPLIDFDSFPVDDLADQLKDISREENEALQRATQGKFDVMAERLSAIESSLDDQRDRDIDLMGQMQKFTTTIVVVIASVCVLGMALVGYMLWRSNTQLAEVASGLSQFPRALQQSSFAGHLEPPREVQSLPAADEETGEKLKDALEQLENRIRELEQTSDDEKSIEVPVEENISPDEEHITDGPVEVIEGSVHETQNESSNGHGTVTLETLLENGESQMNKGAYNKALTTFRKAEELSPDNPEVLVKIGTALEKLRKTEQAIEIYDRAIAKDPGLTIAYLYKGRAFNQMSRFDEALECYERALRTQS